MSKNRDIKRKEELATRTKNESFRFQVEFKRKQKGIDIMGWEERLNAELDAICENGLTEDLLSLGEIIEGVQKELGINQETDKCSLNGAIVPYILGITVICPDSTAYNPHLFNRGNQKLHVTICYSNEVRNQVVEWIKPQYDGVTTRIGQPILKLQNMVVEFKRVLKG